MSDTATDPVVADAAGTGPAAPRHVAPFVALGIAVVVGALVWIMVGAPTTQTDSASTPLLGKPAPAVHVQTLDGKTFDLQRRKGSWVVLNFFNSTCVPCEQEHPELVKFAEQQAQETTDPIELYSIVWSDSAANAKSFFQQNGGTWPVVLDTSSNISVSFGISKVPETWIINPDGLVMDRIIQEVTADGLTLLVNKFRTAYDQASAG